MKKTLVQNLRKNTPLIAVAVNDNCSIKDVESLKNKHLDIAEIRADLFTNCTSKQIVKKLQLFAQVGIPTILTVRSKIEGGQSNFSEEDRVKIFSKCYQDASIVDIESSSIFSSAGSRNFYTLTNKIVASDAKLMVSYHNFKTTPSLDYMNREVIEKATSVKADIIKIACMINNQNDLFTLTQTLMNNTDKKLVIIGMGEYGLLTRLSFLAYGSWLTFAYAGSLITAPGQIHIDTMVTYLKDFYPAYCQNLDK